MASSGIASRFGAFMLNRVLLLAALVAVELVASAEVARSNQLKLIQDMLESYDRKAKPTWENSRPVNVTFSMDLYQILELNEPQQFILLNAWVIERWHDEFLYWNPLDYGNITELRLPYHCIWLPDTTLYNSLVMKDDDTRRLLNAKLTTNVTRKAALIELLYPTIYKFSCLLNLRFFPYDLQKCTMTFSSWTYDQKGIDYLPYSDTIGTSNYLENEGWYLLKTTVQRKEVKYSCCPNKYTLLKLTLYLRRKPLFYMVNLIIPTSIITLIAIVGFFTTSSASGMREEKVSLGITTLLSMSILMLMVSDQMPTTSTFIPLIGWFILGMIFVISLGTLASSVVIAVQKRGRLGERLTLSAVRITKVFAGVSFTEVPPHLRQGTKEYLEAPPRPEAYKKSARIARKLEKLSKAPSTDGSKVANGKRSWFSYIVRRQPRQRTGFASDKSTDALVAVTTDPTKAGMEQDAGVPVDAAFAGSKRPQSPNGGDPSPRGPAPQGRSTSLQLAFHDDETSNPDSQNSSRQPTVRSQRIGKDNMLQHLGVFNENLRLSRQLAQKEYEWLATVMERCCFALFVLMFFGLTIGINLLGYYHWMDVGKFVNVAEDE